MMTRTLLLSVAIIPLWILAAPLYNRALAASLDISLHIFEPDDMGHRAVLEGGVLSIARWIFGIEPMGFKISLGGITFNGAILMALLLASPIPFGKRWALVMALSIIALYMFHLFVLHITTLNPFHLARAVPPAHALLYIQKMSPLMRRVTGTLVGALHAGGWALAPVLIWAVAAGKRAF